MDGYCDNIVFNNVLHILTIHVHIIKWSENSIGQANPTHNKGSKSGLWTINQAVYFITLNLYETEW